MLFMCFLAEGIGELCCWCFLVLFSVSLFLLWGIPRLVCLGA